MHVCPFTTIGGKMLIYKHLPPILLIFSVFLFFFYRRLRRSQKRLFINWLHGVVKQSYNNSLLRS